MDIKKALEEKGYQRYEATIRNNNGFAHKIKIPKGIGNVGDVVEIYAKKIKELREV